MVELEFEWDEQKRLSNIRKHGVDFKLAATIFRNPVYERIDNREDYGEERWIALGLVGSTVYRVVYTEPDENVIRIISAQKAGKAESEIYYGASKIVRH